MFNRKPNTLLLLIVCAGLLFRAWLSSFKVIGVDDSADIYAGKSFLAGEGLRWPEGTRAPHPPIFPIIGALLFTIINNLDLTISLFFVVFGSLIAVPVYLIAKRLYGERAGYIAALIASFIPALNTTIIKNSTQPMFLFFLYCGIYASLRAYQENKVLYYLLAGVFLTVGSFTRGEGQIYFLVIIIILLATRLIEKTLLKKESIKGLVFMLTLFLGSFLIFNLALYPHDNAKKSSYYIFIGGHARAYGTSDDWKGERITDKLYGTAEENEYSILKAVKRNPQAFLLYLAKNVELFFRQVVSFKVFPFFLFLFIGIAFPMDEKGRKDALFLLASSTPVLIYLILIVEERYLTLVVPVLIVWSAKGLCVFEEFLVNTSYSDLKERIKALLIDTSYSLKERIKASFERRILVKLLFGFIILSLLISTVLRVHAIGTRWCEAHKVAGECLKNITHKGERIMARYPQVALYGDLEYKHLPDLDYEQLIEYARENKVRYLFIEEFVTLHTRYGLVSFLKEGKYGDGLRLIMTGKVRGLKFSVYEFTW